MLLSHLPPWLSAVFQAFAAWLDRRTAARLPLLVAGILLASGRRTATSWFRAAGITVAFRRAYHLIHAVGRRTRYLALAAWTTVQPGLADSRRRLSFAIDDTPTARYGPCGEGAGRHHNPTPGPAGEKFRYGHIWVTLAVLARHSAWDPIALPLPASLYIREKDVAPLPPERHGVFHTKLELAADPLRWLKRWAVPQAEQLWVVVDGAYAKRPFLRPAQPEGFTVIGRRRQDAALWSVPCGRRRPGQRGPLPTYGKQRIALAQRAGQERGWQQVECVQYGQRVTKTVKTLRATWRPAGGRIRVVLVREEQGWIPLFSRDPAAGVVDILEATADRGSQEQTFQDVKAGAGAGQQQWRNVHANVGAFNLNLWQSSTVEAWVWGRSAAEVVDRRASPWDAEPRRPSHADKRKALQREVLGQEIEAVLSAPPTPPRSRALAGKRLARVA